MQTSIVIASLLKPVNDTRMFEKMAGTLSTDSKYRIFIIGHESKQIPSSSTISFLPIFSFERLSLGRFFAPWKFFNALFKIRPKIIIVNAHELLGAVTLYKIFTNCKVIYDIRENYFRNVLHGKSVNGLLKPLIAYSIRLNEMVGSLFINHFILAEKSYESELPFIRDRYSILENKVSRKVIEGIQITRISGDKKFLICGTLSEENGVIDGIKFFNRITASITDAHLEIVGYCANKDYWKKIEAAIEGNSGIKVIGGSSLVDHGEILLAIARSNYILMPYQNLPQVINCFPTKIYEAVALKCPILITSYGIWSEFIQRQNAGILVDFNSFNNGMLEQLENRSFYGNKETDQIFWEYNEALFSELIRSFS